MMSLPPPNQPQIKTHYDADGKLSGATCSECGVEIGDYLSGQVTEHDLERFFGIHRQARHGVFSRDKRRT